MEYPLSLNLLWIIPIIGWYASRELTPINKAVIRGVSLGAIISPASLGLYSIAFYFGPVGMVISILGLTLTLIHGAVGYEIATTIGLYPTHTVVDGSGSISIEIINGLFWSLVYSGVYYVISFTRRKKP